MAEYTNLISKAFSEVKAWKMAAFGFAALSFLLTFGLIYNATHKAAYLVPYSLATGDRKAEVAPGELVGIDYVAYVANADLGLLYNWNADTVESQYARFLKRLTPELYAAESDKLRAAASEYNAKGMAQVFYPKKSRLEGHTVVTEGLLINWQGGQEILRQGVSIFISYKIQEGNLYVDDIKFNNNGSKTK